MTWEGPFGLEEVIARLTDGGGPPAYAGEDYGLYQIYGKHILAGSKSLLYVGRATRQTFSSRLRQHEEWLRNEEKVRIFVGRIDLPERHTAADEWVSWERDVCLAECVMIYKYSPHYNSVSIAEPPHLSPFEQVILVHEGERHRLKERDVAPDDWAL
ncbi:MAG TPA: hypothetical protein VGR27_04015 [Longimicrobiaceae bacterium]|nr:hypothetical protein [Longimicrobiaceae bacterium]